MSTIKRVQGDVNDVVIVTCSGVANLNAVTAAEAHVWQRGKTASTLAASVTNAATLQVTVQLGGATGWLATAKAGEWFLETQLTYADGSVLTWPEGAPDVIEVRRQGR